MSESWAAVDHLLESFLLPDDEAMSAALAAAEQAGLPPIQVPPVQGRFLHLLARAIGARRVLEFGTLGGYSTIWLARALPADGRLTTLELNPSYAEVARGNLARAGVEDRVEVVIGPAAQSLPSLDGETFDLTFIDADKQNNPEYFRWALEYSRPGSVIVVDNVIRDGDVIDAGTRDPVVRGVRRMNELIAAEPRVDATALQTVGRKGYDGMTIAVVAA
jgi:predicted O-methyltransferase YrrM